MADILAIVLVLAALGLAYPALLTALRLIFFNKVEKTRANLEAHPWRCLWTGLGLGLLTGLPAFLLIAAPLGLFKFMGWSLVSLILAVATLGGAGLAQILEERAAALASGWKPGLPGLRGAVLLELAAAFPLIGWFLFLPLTTLAGLGAAVPALFRGAPSAALAASGDPRPVIQG
jgi:hypothetical protein